MIDLRTLLDEYLATRRALGVRLEAPERYLKRFVTVVGECEAPFVTTELALRWATRPSHVQSAQWAKRLDAKPLALESEASASLTIDYHPEHCNSCRANQ